MTDSRKIAFDLLTRLLAGERGQVPLLLAMLLERSSPLHSGDDHYRQIMPAGLVDVRLKRTQSKKDIYADRIRAIDRL